MPLTDDCRPIFEDARVLLSDLGFRQYDVVRRVVRWTGEQPGDGTRSAEDTPITIQGRRPGTHKISQKDVIASGGLYEDGDWRIGPFTPLFTGAIGPITDGGVDIDTLDPPVEGTGLEVYWQLTGPGFADGAWFKRIAREVSPVFSISIVVRKLATGEP